MTSKIRTDICFVVDGHDEYGSVTSYTLDEIRNSDSVKAEVIKECAAIYCEERAEYEGIEELEVYADAFREDFLCSGYVTIKNDPEYFVTLTNQ